MGHELIKAGADVNKSDGNKSPHTTAYEIGHLNVVKALRKENVSLYKAGYIISTTATLDLEN